MQGDKELMEDGVQTEIQQDLQEEDSSWEVHSLAEDEESPIPSESEQSSDEESGDEILHSRRRRHFTLS